jgi:deazaflavin-dependent oxidoreductase (nitroreductase family)
MKLADRSWPVLRRLMGGHARIYRATGGLIGHRFPGAPPMLLLDHVGARSGTAHTTPLAYVEDGPDVVVVASKGGHPKHPAWYHNLRAHPDATVQIGRERRAVRARVATAEERARLWPKAVEAYGGYRGYQQRTEREIPLVILEPRVRDTVGTRHDQRPAESTRARGSPDHD